MSHEAHCPQGLKGVNATNTDTYTCTCGSSPYTK